MHMPMCQFVFLRLRLELAKQAGIATDGSKALQFISCLRLICCFVSLCQWLPLTFVALHGQDLLISCDVALLIKIEHILLKHLQA